MNTDSIHLFTLSVRRVDILAVVLFLLLSVLVFYARGGFASRVVDLTSDAANIATMAAVRDHPEAFFADSAFKSPHTTQLYVAVHVPLTRFLARVTGDYGSGFLALLLPTMFLYMASFYFLGVSVYDSRLFGFALSVANVVLIKGPRDTAWGPFKDPLPRFAHAALFAFLVGLLWRWRNAPKRWPWLFLLAGLGVYIHPVATPALGSMVLGGTIGIAISQKRLRQCVLPISIGLFLFLVAIAPFSYRLISEAILRPTKSNLSPKELAQVMEIVEQRFTGNYLSPSRTVLEYLQRPYILFGILPLGLTAGLALSRFSNQNPRETFLYILGMLGGLLVASVVVPIAVEWTSSPWSTAILRGELPRAFRFLVPLTYLLMFAAIREGYSRGSAGQRKMFLLICGVLIAVAAAAVAGRIFRAIRNAFAADATKCAVRELVDNTSASCPSGTPILCVANDPLVIRYSALRPLAFTLKDVPPTDSLKEARKWQENARKYRAIMSEQSTEKRLATAVAWARQLDARYVIIERSDADEAQSIQLPPDTKLRFENKLFILVEIIPAGFSEARE